MARVKQRIYEKSKERTMQSMLEVCEHTFSEMGMEIKTQYLDKTLIEVQGFPPRGSPLGKKNVLTVYKEEDQIFIKLTYEMKDPDQFWDIFETNLAIYGANTEEIEIKAMIVRKITESVEGMGNTIDPEEAWDFLYHYEKSEKNLPDDNEIDEIAIEYIKLKNELAAQAPDQEQEVEELTPTGDIYDDIYGDEEIIVDEESGITVTKTEALVEMVKEIRTLDKESQEYVIGLFEQLLVDDQERLVQKVQAIESDLNKIPYLLDDERKELRFEVLKLDQKKRRKKLIKIINDRKKNEAKFMASYIENKVQADLANLNGVNDDDVNDIMNLILTFPFERKKQIVQIVQEIDHDVKDLIKTHGMQLTVSERKSLRLDLIRLDETERKKTLDDMLEKFKRSRVEEILFEEIPQLRYEDNDKIIKELLWITEEEMKTRVRNLKETFNKAAQKKSEVFQKSSAGSACPKCGWPMGKFSKKCPRCGYNEDDEWFDL